VLAPQSEEGAGDDGSAEWPERLAAGEAPPGQELAELIEAGGIHD
jgi:hypothetical protein